MSTTSAPTPTYATFTTLAFTTLMPEGMCDRAMDLAFLLDGSEALNEDEFKATKDFILGVVERFRMGSAHTRATVLLYYSGVKTYDLQVAKRTPLVSKLQISPHMQQQFTVLLNDICIDQKEPWKKRLLTQRNLP